MAALGVACSEPTRSTGTVEPIPIPHFPADAAPDIDAELASEAASSPCGPLCAAGACDEGVSHRCLFVVDDRAHPDGRVVAQHVGIPVLCANMPPSSAVTITASGDVSTEDLCANWRATLRIVSRRHGRVGSLLIDALGEETYPVHLEGVTASDAEGNVDLVLQVGDMSSNTPGRCNALRFHPHFTLTVEEH